MEKPLWKEHVSTAKPARLLPGPDFGFCLVPEFPEYFCELVPSPPGGILQGPVLGISWPVHIVTVRPQKHEEKTRLHRQSVVSDEVRWCPDIEPPGLACPLVGKGAQGHSTLPGIHRVSATRGRSRTVGTLKTWPASSNSRRSRQIVMHDRQDALGETRPLYRGCLWHLSLVARIRSMGLPY